MKKKNIIKKNHQLPILFVTLNITYHPSTPPKMNWQIKKKAYQVALEVAFELPIKLMFDMHVHIL